VVEVVSGVPAKVVGHVTTGMAVKTDVLGDVDVVVGSALGAEEPQLASSPPEMIAATAST
jgi:hypothetical protein